MLISTALHHSCGSTSQAGRVPRPGDGGIVDEEVDPRKRLESVVPRRTCSGLEVVTASAAPPNARISSETASMSEVVTSARLCRACTSQCLGGYRAEAPPGPCDDRNPALQQPATIHLRAHVPEMSFSG